MHSSGNKSKKKDDDVVEIDAAGYQKSVKDDSKPTKEKSIKKVIPEKPHLQKA